MGQSKRSSSLPAPLAGREALPESQHSYTLEFDSNYLWLKEKAEDDKQRLGIPSHTWCVHGVLYDLTNFIASHPGGSDWITWTKGTDITPLFETHHVDQDKALKVLAKYRVGDLISPKEGEIRGSLQMTMQKYEELSPFTFASKSFYDTLRSRMSKLLPAGQRGPTSEMITYCCCVLIAWTLLFASLCLIDNIHFLLKISLSFLSGYLLYVLFGIGHNFFHQKDNLWMYTTDLSLFSSRSWRIAHAISHHHYANLDIDLEVSALEPHIYFPTNKPMNSIAVFLYAPVFFWFASLIDYCLRIIRSIRGEHRLFISDSIVVFQWGLLAFYNGWIMASIFFIIMQGFACFLLVATSSLVHRSAYAWTEGDPGAVSDWGTHIIIATSDHSIGISLFQSLFMWALFNNHVLHHLFPTIDMSRLRDPSVRALFEQTCHEFKLPYCSTLSCGDLFWNGMSGIWRRGYEPAKTNVIETQFKK